MTTQGPSLTRSLRMPPRSASELVTGSPAAVAPRPRRRSGDGSLDGGGACPRYRTADGGAAGLRPLDDARMSERRGYASPPRLGGRSPTSCVRLPRAAVGRCSSFSGRWHTTACWSAFTSRTRDESKGRLPLARDLGVRATIDIDLFRNAAREVAEAELRAAARQDIGDWFRFEVGGTRPVADAARGCGCR